MPNKKTNDQFLKECEEKGILNKIKILEPYQGVRTKIRCECAIHFNSFFSMRPDGILAGHTGCNLCFREKESESSKLVTEEMFLKRCEEFGLLDKIEFISKYKGMTNKITCRCKIHKNYIWEKIPALLFHVKEPCYFCSNKVEEDSLASNMEELFIEKLTKRGFFDNYELLSKYKDNKTAVKIRCKKHNTINYFRPSILFIDGSKSYGCKECALENVKLINGKSQEEFDAELLEKNSKLKRVGEYKRMDEKIELKCLNCNQSFLTTPNVILSENSRGCPYCSDGFSFPNKVLWGLFEQLQTDFHKREYRDDWTKGYFYDMYFVLNGNKKYVVEADGGFHNRPFEGTEEALIKNQKHDKLKDKLAQDNNVIMIRIDCDKNYHSEIIEAFKQSDLKNLFDLEKVDWLKIIKNAEKSLLLEAIEIFNDNPYLTTKEIAEKINVTSSTVVNYLKQGTKLKLCNYIPKQACGTKIRMFNIDGIFIKEFSSIQECKRFLQKNFNIKVSPEYINRSCRKMQVENIDYFFRYAKECHEEEQNIKKGGSIK